MQQRHAHATVPRRAEPWGARRRPMSTPLEELIAKAIKDADKSFFNEDYVRQARSVMASLKKAGYEVVPTRPPEKLVEWAKENIPFGRLRPADLISQMYTMMIENVRRFDR